MSYDISSYTNTNPIVNVINTSNTVNGVGNSKSGSNSTSSSTGSNSVMSALYSARQQQELQNQDKPKQEQSVMERFQQYKQKHAQQQPVYQTIGDPNNVREMSKQQMNDPPTSIQVVSTSPPPPPPANTLSPKPSNPNLSPSGIPEESKRGSKIARVDFAGSITNGDNEEVAPSVWQSMGTISFDTAVANMHASPVVPSPSPRNRQQAAISNIMRPLNQTTTATTPPIYGGPTTRPNHGPRAGTPTNGGGTLLVSPPKAQKDRNPQKTSFNPDILVSATGNTAIQQQAADLNRATSDSSGSSGAPNSFGKTPSLAMFYPSPVRPAPQSNTTNMASLVQNVMANQTNNNAPRTLDQQAFQQRQQHQQLAQQQQQQQQRAFQPLQPQAPAPPPSSSAPSSTQFPLQPVQVPPPTAVNRHNNVRWSEDVRSPPFAKKDPARKSEPPSNNNPFPHQPFEDEPNPSGAEQKTSTESSSAPAPLPPKSLALVQNVVGALQSTNQIDENSPKLKMAASLIVQERKQEKKKKISGPPPPRGPKLTYWQQKREAFDEWNRKPPKYRPLKVIQALCGLYIVLMSFTRIGTFGNVGGLVDPKTGYIIDVNSKANTAKGVILVNGDYRAVVANSVFQMIALAISRLSAFTMYPALIVVFVSKLRLTTNFLSHTYLGQLFLATDLHDIHIYCGHYILIDGTIHTIFHSLRWAAQGNLYLMFQNQSGVSGVIVIVSTLLICLPMMYGKRKVAYEIRKATHYLFLLFALAMCFHVPSSGFPNGGFAPYVFGILIVWWIVDSMLVQWFLTEKIQSSRFYVLPSGVQLTMAVSERFQSWGTGGYCYVCLPWVNPYQWHAFSLFENPTEPSERQIFMQKLGNWTTQVHSMLGRETSRPVWVSGPFTSPYGNADNYDNQILVAGGIGITPALSVIRQLKDTRRCNLIWATRDQHMLEFFIKHAVLSHKGWNLVFYTGKEQLLGIEDVVVTASGATIHIIRQRPNLHFVIPNIIYGIESGTSMPEEFIPDDKIVAMELLQEKLMELESDSELDSHEKLSEVVNYCDELGYLFSDLISTLPNHEELTKTSTLASMGNKSNQQVLDAILNFKSDNLQSSSRSSVGDSGDKRNMFAGQKGGGSIRSSSRNVLYNASRRRLGGSGSGGALRRRRTSSGSRSSGNERARGRESITTSTWGALAASVQAVQAMKGLGGLGGLGILDEDSEEVDVEEPKMLSMFEQMEIPFKPWEYNQEAEEYVKKMGENELSTWGVLYCGGKSPLFRALQKAARKANIEMHEESFEW